MITEVKVCVLEDEPDARDLLCAYLERYGAEKDRKFSVTCFSTVASFLSEYDGDTDLVFMDIMLPDGDGLSAAAGLREKDKDVTIIFVTNMSQYAIKGYEVRAFDFIVKPVSYNNFSIKLTGALECLRQKRGKELWISNKEGKTRVNTSRIKYIEVSQHMLLYHTLDGVIRQSGALDTVKEELKTEAFALCNRCYLVNLKYVTAVKQFDVFLDGEKLQISRLKRNAFLGALNDYLAKGD
jgi:DNA-binding LytR/AlgR family response regulator